MRADDRRESPCASLPPLASHTPSLPFLPTLVTALILGGFGLLCQSPSPPEPAPTPALDVAAERFEPPPHAAPARPLPGTVAFGRQYPLALAGTAASGRGTRVAGNRSRRCGTGSCDAPKPEPVRSAAHPWRPLDPVATSALPSPVREAEREGPFPTIPDDGLPSALPFAPTASAMIDDVHMVGARAVTLGRSVAGALAILE